MKYALAVLGLVAVVATVAAWRVNFKVAVFGAVIILVLMVAVLVFARLAAFGAAFFILPAQILLYTFVILTAATGVLLFTAAAFKWPQPMYERIFDQPPVVSISPSQKEWDLRQIQVESEDGQTSTVSHMWTDISKLGSEIWLCGAIESGGGVGQFLGRGILLYSANGGTLWKEIKRDRFVDAGSGTLATWGEKWDNVGPINSLAVYRRPVQSGVFHKEGWAATVTGIYSTDDAVNGEWKRRTPSPATTDYAQYYDFANIEAFHEIFAVGWQGIAHGINWGRDWEVQKTAHTYPISGIAVSWAGGDQRDVWAVGRAGVDSQGRTGSDSHGAIYHQSGFIGTWEPMNLSTVKFKPGQTLSAVCPVDDKTIFVVGQSGLILKGSKEGVDWSWIPQNSGTVSDLNSLTYDTGKRTIWIVGGQGVILQSNNLGKTWTLSPSDIKQNLRRIRILDDQRWIVGDQVVLTSSR
jgi:photosystem II stability/assembly factor-like uncharacterized protein